MQEMGQLAGRHEAGDPWRRSIGDLRRSRDHRSSPRPDLASAQGVMILEVSQGLAEHGRSTRRVTAKLSELTEHEAGSPPSTVLAVLHPTAVLYSRSRDTAAPASVPPATSIRSRPRRVEAKKLRS